MVTVEPGVLSVRDVLGPVPLALEVYDALVRIVAEVEDPSSAGVAVRVTRSQVAFRRRTGFCWVWLPGRYLARPAADVVVSVGLARRDPSRRWKEVVRVGEQWWMHHLEVRSVDELDDEVAGWVAEAHDQAG